MKKQNDKIIREDLKAFVEEISKEDVLVDEDDEKEETKEPL